MRIRSVSDAPRSILDDQFSSAEEEEDDEDIEVNK
jgi:hypothetical protein